MRRSLLRTVLIDGAARSPLRDRVLSYALLACRIKDAQPELSGMNHNAQTGISSWNRVVRPVDLDVAIEMGPPFENAVVLEACCRQWRQSWAFFLEHFAHLTFGGTVDARSRPSLVPPLEGRVLFIDTFETSALERRCLRVTDGGLDLPLEIGRIRSARQRDDAVMGQHRCVQRVDFRVHVGLDDPLAQVVQPHRLGRSAEVRERRFVQIAPSLRRRVPNRCAIRMTTRSQRHHEEAWATVLSRAWIPRQRAFAVIDLRFLTRRRLEPAAHLGLARAQFAYEPLTALYAPSYPWCSTRSW